MKRKPHKYTAEQIEYLKEISKGRLNIEITRMFNEKFDLNLGEGAISSTKKRYGITSGNTSNSGQFKKGQAPWNKGIKTGIVPSNVFSKGHELNCKPIGSERICSKDGYTLIKMAEPDLWEHKHRVIYKEHHGQIPEGHVVIFGDGDKSNFDIDNLILVSRRQLLTLNSNDLIQNDADLTRTAIIIADLQHKISDRRKK